MVYLSNESENRKPNAQLELVKPLDRGSVILPDRDIIHYMADLYTINQDNPFLVPDSKTIPLLQNVTSLPENSRLTPTDHVLTNPDSNRRAGLTDEGGD